jgi:hypothetical protein
MGFKRCIIYFINSIMGFRLSFKNTFGLFNRHLFFPLNIKINNVIKNFKLFFFKKLTLKKLIYNKIKLRFKKKKLFFLKSGKSLLRKMFISSKWAYGFISNSSSFFFFSRNILKEKIKFGKSITFLKEKLKCYFDFYPFLPSYGFLGDHKTNFWVINELYTSKVPTSSVVDTFTEKALFSMYGIPGNSCSIDSTVCLLIFTISNYLIGFYKQILYFCFDKLFFNENKKNILKKGKKKVFFKFFKIYCCIKKKQFNY